MSLTPKQSPVLWSMVILTVTIRVATAQSNVLAPATGAMRIPSLPQSAASTGIAYFRELLSAKPEDREKLLIGKAPEVRNFLEKSIRRYEALAPEERELRLRTMELRYHVTALVRTAATNRVQRLASVPENLRPLVEDRLKYWDTLSPELQKIALQNEVADRIVVPQSGSGANLPPGPFNRPASNQIVQIERQLVRWQSLPEGRREQIQRNFTTLFEFSDEEKAKAQLQALPLSSEERDLMEKPSRTSRSSRSPRELCMRNFPKFAELSPEERRQFLYNAQEWQKMSSADRETWRKLVSKVPRLPPLPPGIGRPPPPKLATKSPVVTVQDTNR
ncbi:MAG: DUF3106 domain-containing protein [Verrucomicrobia bacterium]|nr:DUF3106 domain-containing protein [Verrucomicrobiota bacterium]